MKAIACCSLAGGQGKTSISLLLGRFLAQQGKRILLIDGDPQASLTFWSGFSVPEDKPTLLEVLTKATPTEQGIYSLDWDNLWLIPADDALDKVQRVLADMPMGELVLRKRLEPIQKLFDYCLIDAPPQRSHLCLSILGAADLVIIPAEASTKGCNSLLRSLDLIREMEDAGAFRGSVLGIVPFRDRWVGRSQSTDSRDAIAAMKEFGGGIPILPSLLESERFKQAIRKGQTLAEMGFEDLEYPIRAIAELLESSNG